MLKNERFSCPSPENSCCLSVLSDFQTSVCRQTHGNKEKGGKDAAGGTEEGIDLLSFPPICLNCIPLPWKWRRHHIQGCSAMQSKVREQRDEAE